LVHTYKHIGSAVY